ncbi:hemerythrin domain-containing protein [Noviherbaspirillum pedocola]|uniref:Hemerythrin domain-containing protein n=1 Tax=Noviherbaspirillum pedocola TaxID=2801341 RepID=A0A934STA8_9BURK|nr:hemerythrin domain-containing protein [Noviherbaspirillum pedocola]MBK4734838.1 hemerythrin domain-containing protein [Noviherbaspirillum pedocola]
MLTTKAKPSATSTLRMLHEEHERLAAILQGLRHLLRAAQSGAHPDAKVFRAMLLYIADYPERLHHPKEDQWLFAPLARHTGDYDEVINELETQHAEGEAMVRELEHMVIRYEFGGAALLLPLRDMVERYADFYFRHMRLEEETLFPVLTRFLTDEEWRDAHRAFSGNVDPLAGQEVKGSFDKLFSTIVSIAPAPIGLGPELQ